MTWTEPPRTWSDDELVTPTIMNTHVRDQLIYLKQNPVISEQVLSASNVAAYNSTVTVLTTGSVAIPSDLAAVYVEAWGHYYAASYGTGHINWSLFLNEASAGVLSRVGWYEYNDGNAYSLRQGDNGPWYLRSRDLAWAGTSRTVTLQLYASNLTAYALCVTQAGVTNGMNFTPGPIVLRVMRSY